jgi:hypothetical protein
MTKLKSNLLRLEMWWHIFRTGIANWTWANAFPKQNKKGDCAKLERNIAYNINLMATEC